MEEVEEEPDVANVVSTVSSEDTAEGVDVCMESRISVCVLAPAQYRTWRTLPRKDCPTTPEQPTRSGPTSNSSSEKGRYFSEERWLAETKSPLTYSVSSALPALLEHRVTATCVHFRGQRPRPSVLGSSPVINFHILFFFFPFFSLSDVGTPLKTIIFMPPLVSHTSSNCGT